MATDLWNRIEPFLPPFLRMALAALVSRIRNATALRAAVAPTIVFVQRVQGKPWSIENQGKGPALNLRVQGRRSDGQLSQAFKHFSIPAGGQTPNRTSFGDVLIAVYEDTLGNTYIGESANNTMTIPRLVSKKELKKCLGRWDFSNAIPAYDSSIAVV